MQYQLDHLITERISFLSMKIHPTEDCPMHRYDKASNKVFRLLIGAVILQIFLACFYLNCLLFCGFSSNCPIMLIYVRKEFPGICQ